jgi:hypothetical protein
MARASERAEQITLTIDWLNQYYKYQARNRKAVEAEQTSLGLEDFFSEDSDAADDIGEYNDDSMDPHAEPAIASSLKKPLRDLCTNHYLHRGTYQPLDQTWYEWAYCNLTPRRFRELF